MPSTITPPLTDPHQLLLKAACCTSETGIQAWQQWHTTANIEQLDSESYRLLPLLSKNLVANQVQTSEMTRLQGVYRRYWYSNQLMIRELTTVLQALQAANINFLLVGDAVLLGYYGADLGMRPVEQLDVVVSPQDASKAIQVLAQLNWQAKATLTDSFKSLHSKIGLWNSSHLLLHLHWRLFGVDVPQNLDSGLWQTAESALLHQAPVRTLNSVDQILYICTRIATTPGAIAPLWIADFAKVVNARPSHNLWERLIEGAVNARLVLALQRLINAGVTILELPIPSAVVQRIQSLPISSLERLEQRFGQQSARSPLARYLQYLRQAESSHAHQNILMSMLNYGQHAWGLQQSWQVPIYGAFRLVNRLAWRARSRM